MTLLERQGKLLNSAPITALWNIRDQPTIGTLSWEGRRPRLELFIDLPTAVGQRLRDLSHPVLDATKPPHLIDITGQVAVFGFLTLDECYQADVKEYSHPSSSRVGCIVTLHPSRIWFGRKIEKSIVAMELADARLGGYFRSPGIVVVRRDPSEHASAFEALGNPSEIWTVRPHNGDAIPLGSTGFTLKICSTVNTQTSQVHGNRVAGVTVLQINSAKGTNIDEFESIKLQLEQLLSTFALEDFRFEGCSFLSDLPDSSELAWSLGDCGTSFVPPMNHQILIDFSNREILISACRGWFDANDIVKLSRWLFCRALRETDDGLGRFIGVAQALEVLGREVSNHSKIVTRSERKRAVSIIEGALREAQVDQKFIERIVGLANNSNIASFPEFLRDMIGPLVARLFPAEVVRLHAFCKLVAETRNDVVHMNDNREQLNEAFERVAKLSLKLCWWFALIQADLLRIPLDTAQVMSFHINNRNARHGLPNDVLDWL